MADRDFKTQDSLEREIKELYLSGSFNTGAGQVAAVGTLDLTEDIVLTSVALGASRNTTTFETVVNAAAANDTDEVLVVFTGTAAAIVCTVTPNDGTNNSATPVDLTTEELVELINTGAVVGKNVVITDASSLRELQTAIGGDTTALAAGGEGDEVEATFANGYNLPELNESLGIVSLEFVSTGKYKITLDKTYNKFKDFSAILLSATAQDVNFQVISEAVATSKEIVFATLAGASVVNVASGSFLAKIELKNTSVQK